DLLVEVFSHQLPGAGPGSSPHAGRMARVGRDFGVGVVLTNAVRYADRLDAPVVDVLDAVRRLVPLDARHLDRGNAEGFLKSGKEMAEIAAEVCRFAGFGEHDAPRLLAHTRTVAERCAVDPRADLGLGEVHLPDLDTGGRSADAVLRVRCEEGVRRRYTAPGRRVWDRLDDELAMIAELGYAAYFLTVGDVCDLIRDMDVRCAARGSGAGSLVNYALGVSGVDPIRHGLLMERFLSPLRQALPDVDVDVESARRTEVYERILERFGSDRCTCVSMMDTYRVRHAVRDVGMALGMPAGEVDAIAKAFPHIRARDARLALRDLPELRASGLAEQRLDVMFRLVERLDGLPRHVALHPCGVLLSDRTLLDRTPIEASYAGFPMSQFDKDDVEDLGLLKLDVLGVRMQSAMAHAVDEVARVEGERVDLDDERQVPHGDPATFELIQHARTLGCFQIESPGQRELVGKFAPETFDDILIDISLFRPGPVKSDMVTPFLRARQGWAMPDYLHPDLEPVLRQTSGVVVFHEQVVEIVATFTGCDLAQADEARRALGDREGQADVRLWFFPRALGRGYPERLVQRVWAVLEAFASFGFCKAHAAAFALPTYQSAWLKAHHPAHFLAGVLTHDPGMYPKRLILDDARQFGVTVLPLDVNASDEAYRVERVGEGRGIRLALAEVKGVSDAEVAQIVAGRPYHSLTDFWHRAHVSRPVAERLVLAGAFDTLYGIGAPGRMRRRGTVTRRDLLLQVADLDRWSRATQRAHRRASSPGQLTLDLGDEPGAAESTGLPEMSGAERVRAELEVLGLDASRHVVDFYVPLLRDLGVVPSRALLHQRSRSSLLVAGVKVATQTPPIRSGRRVVFLTLDDGTGPIDATFFEDAQGPYAATLFHSWLLLVRGELRRTGPRGVSLRATGCWELTALHALWQREGTEAVRQRLTEVPPGFGTQTGDEAVQGAAQSRSTRPVMADPPGRQRVLVHASGFKVSPYADVRPAGGNAKDAPRKLWHSSPGSPG
ncbi:MAG: DNA polymerase III subunit alpha, partial [Actinomycetota bacterium]|nr:DNA polymerase III subunit alpha [Actinomycetota bacterium]